MLKSVHGEGNASQRRFEKVVNMENDKNVAFDQVVSWLKSDHPIHLTFLLGFYVSLVVKRWWEQYVKMPWPDEVAIHLKASITRNKEGDDEENLRIRRTVVRYMILSYLLCMRRISSSVRKKYPTLDHLIGTHLIRKDEVIYSQ